MHIPDKSGKDKVMKIKVMVLSCLIAAGVLFVGYESSLAESKSGKPSLQIGVISVEKILRESKRSAKFRTETIAERERIIAELDKLKAEIEADKAGLKTLKAGSSDHSAQVMEILTKQANHQAQQEFHKQQIAMKEQKMIEGLYKDILAETVKVAEKRGLDSVFEKTEPEFPMRNAEQLSQTISTHKLLYSGGCLDITDEVMSRLDAGN